MVLYINSYLYYLNVYLSTARVKLFCRVIVTTY